MAEISELIEQLVDLRIEQKLAALTNRVDAHEQKFEMIQAWDIARIQDPEGYEKARKVFPIFPLPITDHDREFGRRVAEKLNMKADQPFDPTAFPKVGEFWKQEHWNLWCECVFSDQDTGYFDLKDFNGCVGRYRLEYGKFIRDTP